jgi:hypothetical protein
MLSKKLASKIKDELSPKATASFNLNFKIDGEDADKFDQISKTLKKSRTELAKFIITNSLDDLLEHLDSFQMTEKTVPIELRSLDETIITLTKVKISALKSGERFELKELIAQDWDQVGEHGDKNRAGKRFKKLIESDHVSNVKFLYTKSNNHALYEKL